MVSRALSFSTSSSIPPTDDTSTTYDGILIHTDATRHLTYSPDPTLIGDPTIRSIADRFLGVGETVFDTIQGTAVSSSYFKRSGRER